MITIGVAGLAIGLDTDCDYVRRMCDRFLTEEAPDFTVRASAEEIAAEQKVCGCSASVAEFVCLYRAIAERLPDYDRFVLHGATLRTGGKAYIFTAKSGTGKSTHVRLWLERYGDAVKIVNGDKPIVWRRDGVWYACGTPWCGKEGLTSTDCVPVGGLCFLERAAENTIRPAQTKELAERIFHQIYRPKDVGRLVRFLELLDGFLTATPCWHMGCNMDVSAAETAYEAMVREPGNAL